MKRLLIASALTLAMVSQGLAVPYPPYPPPKPMVPPGSTNGTTPWVPSCIMGGAAGLILAAIVVGRTQNRELTQAEALGTAFTCGLGAFLVGYQRPVAAPAAPVRTRY
jgi:hypothetical protein